MDGQNTLENDLPPSNNEKSIRQPDKEDLFTPVGYPDQWRKYSQKTQKPSDMTPFFRKADRKSKAQSKEELQALFKELQGYTQAPDHIQNKKLFAQQMVYSKHYCPESLIAITIRPTTGGRCNLICRNNRGQVLAALSNIRELKRYRKISCFVEDKPKIILIVNDYCLSQNLESLAILHLIAKKVDFCLIHSLATSSFINFVCSLPPVDQIVYSPSQFEAYSALRDPLALFQCPTWTRKFEVEAMGSSWYGLKTKSMCLLSESVARIAIGDCLKVLWQMVRLEDQQNKLLQQWRGPRQDSERVLMFEMMAVNYNRCWGRSIQPQFIIKMEQDLAKPSEEPQLPGSLDDHYPKLVNTSRKCIQCLRAERKKSSKWICIGCSAAAGVQIHLCLLCMAKFHKQRRRVFSSRRSKVKNCNQKRKIIRRVTNNTSNFVKVEESVDLKLLTSKFPSLEELSRQHNLSHQQIENIYSLQQSTEQIFSLIRQRIAAHERNEAQRLLNILQKLCVVNTSKFKLAEQQRLNITEN